MMSLEDNSRLIRGGEGGKGLYININYLHIYIYMCICILIFNDMIFIYSMYIYI